MSSGQKQIVINTRERAVSSDQNRTEAFIACDRSQLARFQYNDQRQNTYLYPGVSKQNVGTETPMAAEIFGGLMVDPGATSLLITPGEIGCLFPDPAITADDSPYMLINDPGQQTAGILTFTANASGSTRIDLVECQPVSTIIETDNRDIFNPATGLFAPASVTKVQAFRLQYRIRTGVGGSGVPALQAGWLPLAVIVVASGAADFNACDFYDVRPLVSERVRAQPAYIAGTFQPSQYCPVRDAEYFSLDNAGSKVIEGYSETQFGGYVAGGWIRRSSPSFSGTFGGTGLNDGDPDFVNLSNAENQTPGFAPAANQVVYLAAFFPAQLPRWVRYSQTAVGGGLGRVPKGPRGILLATTNNVLRDGVVPPIVIGHGFTAASPGVVLGAMFYNPGGTDFLLVNAQGSFHKSAKRNVSAVTATAVAGVVSFALTAGTHYPTNASELDIDIGMAFTNGGATDTVQVVVELVNGTSVYLLGQQLLTAIAGNSGGTTTIRVPLIARPDPLNAGGPSTTIRLTASGSATFNTGANLQTATVSGFRLGS